MFNKLLKFFKKSKMARKTVKLKEKEVKTKLTPQEKWQKAVSERKTTPQWSCVNKKVPIYKWKINVLLNEEPAENDNKFYVGEKLNISPLVDRNDDKKDKIEKVPGVGILLLSPDGKQQYMVTDEDGDVDFVPHTTGTWRYVVDDIGIAPTFPVIKRNG